jgi:hypothetical protein
MENLNHPLVPVYIRHKNTGRTHAFFEAQQHREKSNAMDILSRAPYTTIYKL